MSGVIEIRNVEKTFSSASGKRKVVLHNLNLTVPQGSVYGFLGPNGAGKSTTIKLLLNFIRTDTGTLTIFGKPVDTVSIKNRIGYLSEYPCFYSQLTVLETVIFAGRLCGKGAKQINSQAMSLLKRVNLHEATTLKVSACSKGMQQRLGLAAALIHDPELLIFDEPMSGLDPVGRHLVKTLILELKNRGKTIFFSTHILSDIEDLCDQVGLIHKGVLLFEGDLDNFTVGGTIEDAFLSRIGQQGRP